MPPAMTFQEYSDMLDRQETNCKDIILSILPKDVDIKCVDLSINRIDKHIIKLRVNHTSREQLKFWLDVDVDTYTVKGTIWLKDDTWLEIKRLNNFEKSWKLKSKRSCPKIPKELR